MSTLKALRTRIKTVKATQKITTAMKLVSAAKLRRAQDQLGAFTPYAKNMEAVWQKALKAGESEDFPKWLTPQGEEELIIVLMADRGLCGSYNAVMARHIRKMMGDARAQKKSIKILPLGFKALDLLRGDLGNNFLKLLFENREKKPSLSQVFYSLSTFLEEHLQQTSYGSVRIVFTEFRSILRQEITEIELLIQPNEEKEMGYGPLIEPSPKELIESLAFLYLNSQLRYALYQSQTAEQAARMRAMDTATDNANEVITRLNRTYNRTRQAGITRELIEIISGANALAS